MDRIHRLSENEVYVNDHIRVFDDSVQFASGRTGTYVRILDPHGWPGVVLIAVDGDSFCVVRTFRYAIGKSQWGFPRGFGEDRDPLHTAAQELREEVGATASSLRVIGEISPDSGLLGTTVAVVVAQDVEVDELADLDVDEVEEVKWVERDELFNLLTLDGPADGFSLAALTLYDHLT